MKYIVNMRKSLCNNQIIFDDGSLNLKYFNVKKGHYWSNVENEKLIQGVIERGATDFKQIRKIFLPNWTETEIRLRICKLLRYYDLDHYKEVKFTGKDMILEEAQKNREQARKLDLEAAQAAGKSKPKDTKLVGGIYFNPPPLSVINKENEGGTTQFNNFFTKKPAKTEDNMDEK